MTEAEWLMREDPEDMLRFIKQHRGMQRKEKQRKQRLFSAACCRRIWALIDNDRSRESVEVAERFADGQATSEELRDAEAGASADWSNRGGNDALFACVQVCWKTVDGMHVSTTTISAAYEAQQRKTGKPVDVLGGRRRGACPREEREQCRILRCIFGNPFRPVFIDSAWQTGTIISLERHIRQETELRESEKIVGHARLELFSGGCSEVQQPVVLESRTVTPRVRNDGLRQISFSRRQRKGGWPAPLHDKTYGTADHGFFRYSIDATKTRATSTSCSMTSRRPDQGIIRGRRYDGVVHRLDDVTGPGGQTHLVRTRRIWTEACRTI